MRQPIGILTHDQVTFFQSQQALRLDAEWPQAVAGAGLRQCVPDREPGAPRAKTWSGVLGTATGLLFYGQPNGGSIG